MICQYCHRNLVSENAYEDGIYSILIRWLNAVTCINWHRYYPEVQRPGEADQQYGMVFIPRYRPKRGTSTPEVDLIEVTIDGEVEQRHCLTIEETEEFDIDLYVFREMGKVVRTDQTGPDHAGQSAADVLKQVNILLAAEEFTHSLSTAGVQIERTDNIDVMVEKRNGVWEWQAAAQVTGTVCRQVSFPIANEELVYCVETCDGTPVCTRITCEE